MRRVRFKRITCIGAAVSAALALGACSPTFSTEVKSVGRVLQLAACTAAREYARTAPGVVSREERIATRAAIRAACSGTFDMERGVAETIRPATCAAAREYWRTLPVSASREERAAARGAVTLACTR